MQHAKRYETNYQTKVSYKVIITYFNINLKIKLYHN